MRTIIAASCVVGLTLCFSIEHSFANPTGGSVVGGDANATIAGQGTALTTINQSANQVIINWQNFSIGAGEITRFVQPSDTAAALNRVTSGNPSQIYGSLQANGRVFVINPNGILVGPSGQIDTKGFVASTLDVPDSSFQSGANLILSGNSSASVRNEGSIQALGGDVYLIAHSVENDGTINAPQGTVGLAAGSQVQLVQSGNEHLSVLAGNPSAPATAVGVNNSGTIQAASAELKAAGGNIYALAINNGGIVRATGIVNKNGHIYLAATGGNIQNSGTLAANNANGSGGTIIVDGGHNATMPSTVINSGLITANSSGSSGGQVELLGDQVAVGDGGVVDVSGGAGGGTVLIGGDLHGANPEIQNAQATFISPGAQINADALTLGNGGKVVVWSDDATRFYGSISARGGALGGNGGSVEVSGNQSLQFAGTVDAAAPGGTAGQLLLDPTTLYIINGAAGTGDQDGNLPITFASADTALNTLSVGELQSLGNVNITLQAQNSITIGNSSSAPADLNLSGTLTSGARTLTLSAGNGSGGAGNVVFNPGSSIETGGGNVTINAGQAGDTDGSATLGAVSTGSGALTINALNGVAFNGAVNAGAVTLNNSGAATGSGLITATTLTLQGGGAVGTSGARLQTAVGTLVDSKSGGHTYVGQTGALNLHGTTTGAGLLDVLCNVGITVGAALNIDSGTTAGDTLALNGTTIAINNPITANAVTLNNSGAVTGGGLITATTLTLQGGGAVGTSGTRLKTAVGTLADDKSGGNTYVNQTGALNLDGTTTGAGLLDMLCNAGITVDAALNIDNGAAGGDTLALNGTTMAMNNPVTANAVTLDNSGALTGSGQITATTLTLNGNGSVGTSGARLQTAVGTLTDDKSGGDTYVNQTGVLNLDGTTTGAGLLDVVGNAGITIDAALNIHNGSTAGDTLALSGTTMGINNPVTANAVTLNNNGAVTGSGLITAPTLTLQGGGAVGASGARLQTKVGTLVDDKSGGDTYVNQAGALNLDGTTTGAGLLDVLCSAGITVDAALNIDNGLAGGDTLALSGTTMAINNPVTANAVTLNNGGTATGSGLITATTLTLQGGAGVGLALARLQTAVGTLVDDKSGGNTYVNQTGALNLDGTTTGSGLLDVMCNAGITVDAALNIHNGSTVGDMLALSGTTMAINNPVTANAVTLNNSGAVTGSGLITATTLTLQGGGAVGTSIARLQSKAGTLVDDKSGGDTYVNQTGALNLDGTTTGAGLLDVVGNAGITVDAALNIDNGLALGDTLALSGTTMTINNPVTAYALTLNNSGVATLSGTVTTTAGQTYNGALALGNNLTLNGTTLSLAGVTGGNNNLTLGNSGLATLNGAVSGVKVLTANAGTGTLQVNNTIAANKVVDNQATTLSGATVTTTAGNGQDGSQTYNNPVTLGTSVTLSSIGNGNISLNSTADADNALNNRTLQVNTGGTATFGNSVGALNALGGLTVNAGTISLGGAVIVNSLGTVDLVSPGNIAINFGITTGTLTVHSGTDGTGNIGFGPSVTIDANTQSYQAGDGTGGGGTTATADLVDNAPVFNNYSASGAPASFTFRQDASITAGEVPVIAPATYTIESDDGSVQLPGLNLPGNLNVTADGPITQTGGGLQVGGTATFAAGAANDITLDNLANNFNNIIITSGRDVTLYDINTIVFGPLGSTISGNLSVTTGDTGNVNFSGTPTTSVLGNLTVVAGGDLNGTYIVGGTVSITVGGQNNGSLSRFLSGLSQVEIPVPRPENTTFSTASISVDQAAKILPPGAIGTLWLQIPFPHEKEKNYRIEDISKWTSGPIAAAGSTSGPQVPK